MDRKADSGRARGAATLLVAVLAASTPSTPAAAGPPPGVPEAPDGSLMACVDDLPDGVDVEVSIAGRVNTGGTGPRFRGRIVVDDGTGEDGPEPPYYEPLMDCLREVVSGSEPPPEPSPTVEQPSERMLVF